MAIPVSSRESTTRSRRALLVGALGGLGAVAATAVGRVSPVRAADGGPVLLGTANNATTSTSVTSSGAGDAFQAFSSPGNDAVNGYATTGRGVYGNSSSGSGVHGISGTGIGVEAISSRVALQTFGRLKFSTSGVATISGGATSRTITPGVDINPSSFVLLTPKANIGTRALWFTTDGPNERFTIHMSPSRGVPTKVAWLLVG